MWQKSKNKKSVRGQLLFHRTVYGGIDYLQLIAQSTSTDVAEECHSEAHSQHLETNITLDYWKHHKGVTSGLLQKRALILLDSCYHISHLQTKHWSTRYGLEPQKFYQIGLQNLSHTFIRRWYSVRTSWASVSCTYEGPQIDYVLCMFWALANCSSSWATAAQSVTSSGFYSR